LIYGDFSENDVKINGDLEVTDDLDVYDQLHVHGYYDQGSHSYSYFKYGSIAPITGTWNASADYSIRADECIRADEFHAVSDQRIKTNFKLSEGKADLDLINKIEVTNYTHIDTLSEGSQYKKGFIAQQVESVYPQAVSQSTDFIPDIYCFSASTVLDSIANTLAINLTSEHKLEQGEMLRFFGTTNMYEQEVLEIISPTQFVVAAVDDRHDHMFIFGKQVDDFRAVDYDQVFSIGISAIQELARQNEELNMANEKLTLANEKLKKSDEELHTRLDALESMIKNPGNANSIIVSKK